MYRELACGGPTTCPTSTQGDVLRTKLSLGAQEGHTSRVRMAWPRLLLLFSGVSASARADIPSAKSCRSWLHDSTYQAHTASERAECLGCCIDAWQQTNTKPNVKPHNNPTRVRAELRIMARASAVAPYIVAFCRIGNNPKAATR